MLKYLPYIVLLGLIPVGFSCGDNSVSGLKDSFNRIEMLDFWASDIIIPSLENYHESLIELNTKTEAFFQSPQLIALEELRSSWKASYFMWQSVSMFDIGKAETLTLRNFSNIYPCDTELILANIEAENSNLELPSNYVSQGFPALDFLLFGTGNSDEEILNFLSEERTEIYFKALTERLESLAKLVVEDWKENYKQEFIANDGSSATASVDKMVNDYVFYYEKFLRAGKVGIPAGVFSGSILPNNVEAPFSAVISKDLFIAAMTSTKDFFHGKSVIDGLLGISLADYLDHIREMNGGEDIVLKLDNHWNTIDNLLSALQDDFSKQVVEDNNAMLELYDEIQKTVILLKVDMLQAFNIQVDYVDADGD